MKTYTIIILLLVWSAYSKAIPTRMVVRAKAKDAKFIGSSIGGAYVIIRNTLNNKILAEGLTEGSTGNTDLIMRTPGERGKTITDAQTAKFATELDLTDPVFVRVEVRAPVNKKQATAAGSVELWLIPGKHIEGEGIVIEIPGFIVDILQPRTHQYISLKNLPQQQLRVQANIVMMCGCTISKGGLWDSEKIEVKGILKREGKLVKEITLKQEKEVNLFEATIAIQETGKYELTVYAYHAPQGNTGLDKINYIITP